VSVTCDEFSPVTPVSFTNKPDRHDIIELLLKVLLNTTTQTLIEYTQCDIIICQQTSIKKANQRPKYGLSYSATNVLFPWKEIRNVVYINDLITSKRTVVLKWLSIKDESADIQPSSAYIAPQPGTSI